MCQSVKRLTFCTCEVDPAFFEREAVKKRGQRGPGRYSKHGMPGEEGAPNPVELVWILKRHVMTNTETHIIGRVSMAANQLTTDLTSDVMLSEINSRNCFDFDFEPAELDYLRVQKKGYGDYSYMAFQYYQGQWREGWDIDTLNEVMEQLGMGKVCWTEANE